MTAKTKRVGVLGGSGMLGSMIVSVLSRESGLEVVATARRTNLLEAGRKRLPRVRWVALDAERAIAEGDFSSLAGASWVVNAIGITKPLVHDDNAFEVERAIRMNALLPLRLASWAEKSGARILQIATDCVYSGASGDYIETDPHDALDVYGKTKSLGEVRSPNMHHLRCSVVGPEPKDFKFLVEWFRRQPRGATVPGYVNHRWNGLTTLHFARLCFGVIREGIALPHCQHVVPEGTVTKAELLALFAEALKREDLIIDKVEAATKIDRVLRTRDPALNLELWRAAGYKKALTVGEQLRELGLETYELSDLGS